MFTKNNATDGNLLAPIKVVEEGGNFDARRAKIVTQTAWFCAELVQEQAVQAGTVAATCRAVQDRVKIITKHSELSSAKLGRLH